MFDDKKFGVRKLSAIYRDIEHAGEHYHGVRSVFLTDGNVLVLSSSKLLKILQHIKTHLPTCQRVAMYASFTDLRKKSVDELRALCQAGLDIVYVGLESGDADILRRVKKHLTPAEALEGMAHAKAAGLAVHCSLIFGLGGREHTKTHIEATAALLNDLKPEEISCLSLSVQPCSELEQEVLDGSFTPVSALQLLQEELYLLEHIAFPTLYWGDHANNLVSKRGFLPERQEEFIQILTHAIEHHPLSKADSYSPRPW